MGKHISLWRHRFLITVGSASDRYHVTPFFWRPENFVEGFFFCFHLHCSDERISESQIAGLIRIRPNERIFTIDLRPNTASYSSVLWNASKLFLWTDFISLHVYAYTFMNMPLTLQEVNTLVKAYGVSVWIRMSAISFFVATLPCFISHFRQQKGNWQTLLVFMFPRERVFPILRTASQFLCQNFARCAK